MSEKTTTPLMRQYAQVKAKNPDALLLFRMGDFFETFNDDAKTLARICGITLTKRSNGQAAEVPLAGFPHHQLENYLPKLVRAGFRVAVCEQMEDPKFARGIVKRDVVEVVTPGAAFHDKLIDPRRNNYLASVFISKERAGVAFCDVTTAEFQIAEVDTKDFSSLVETISPAEIIVSKNTSLDQYQSVLATMASLVTRRDDWVFTEEFARERLAAHFKTQSLKGFGVDDLSHGIIAAGALIEYLGETQMQNLAHLGRITRYEAGAFIALDSVTKRNLELTASKNDFSQEGSLINVIDVSVTPMGSRMVKRWLLHPLRSREAILWRLEAVDEFVHRGNERIALERTLDGIGDLERLIAKVATSRATPRELIALAHAARKLPQIIECVKTFSSAAVKELSASLRPLDDLATLIETAIDPQAPAKLDEGGVVRAGYNTELDELRMLSRSGKEIIAKMQERERERTGIGSLKVSYNNVFGYFIEVTKTHLARVPEDYQRKQTTSTSERYVTPELKTWEEKILTAQERALALEREIVTDVRSRAARRTEDVQFNARIIATIDALSALAETAVVHRYVKPTITEDHRLAITGGRHPVVETLLPPSEKFVPNDTALDIDATQIHIITGPNMAGKSVYLRQVGLITLLAHIGSFVPAAKADIGIVDKIFTRVGASDNLAAGESTFLVEMHETANILNNATRASLVLLDEIGRGTSTFDGVSIAWAVTEYLHNRIGAKTLFATHYHELNELAALFPRVKNYKVDVIEEETRVHFLHKVSAGSADHSYGIQVAEMAGLPSEATENAKKILRELESGTGIRVDRTHISTMPTDGQVALFEIKDDALAIALRSLDVNTMTPLEALSRLAELKILASK